MLRSRFIRYCVSLSGVIAFPLALSVAPQPATAASGLDFQACAYYLKKAGISEAVVSNACGAALYPREISTCVTRIDFYTNVAAEDALNACLRVRRPLEYSTCVIDISRATKGATGAAIIDNCRRAVLPKQFSSCVTGLSQQTSVATDQLFTDCLDGRFRPRDFYPTRQSPVSPIPNPPPALPPVPELANPPQPVQ